MVKDEFLIAVDPKSPILPDAAANSAQILKDAAAAATTTTVTNKPFKSFAWSQPVLQLGMFDKVAQISLMIN